MYRRRPPHAAHDMFELCSDWLPVTVQFLFWLLQFFLHCKRSLQSYSNVEIEESTACCYAWHIMPWNKEPLIMSLSIHLGHGSTTCGPGAGCASLMPSLGLGRTSVQAGRSGTAGLHSLQQARSKLEQQAFELAWKQR